MSKEDLASKEENLSPVQAGMLLNVDPRTIRRWLDRGLPHIQDGRIIRISKAALLAHRRPNRGRPKKCST